MQTLLRYMLHSYQSSTKGGEFRAKRRNQMVATDAKDKPAIPYLRTMIKKEELDKIRAKYKQCLESDS